MLGDGAAQAAPTAPHATPRRGPRAPASGPERFWSRWRTRAAFVACLLISLGVHLGLVPIGFPHGLEIKDTEGEAAIPVDLLAPEAPPPEPPAPPPEPPAPKDEQDALDKHAAALAAQRRSFDAGLADAGPDARIPDAAANDASVATDAGPVAGDASIAGADGGGLSDAATVGEGGAATDAAPPENIIATTGATASDTVLVELVINAQIIRQNAIGRRIGNLLRGVPQWEDFMSGTDVDPVRDTDWVAITGPSLVNTARDVVLIRYAASDAAVDRAIAIVSRKYDRGGKFDTGVPGVKATLAHADRAERVLLRAQTHVLAVVPPDRAGKIARQLALARLPAQPHPDEAVHFRMINPRRAIPELPEAITELRLRVMPGAADEGADVFMEGDTKDDEAAAAAAVAVRAMVRRHNDAITSLVTHGLLNGVAVSSEGSKVLMKDHVTADQIETLTALVEGMLGVPPPAEPGGAPPPVPQGTRLK